VSGFEIILPGQVDAVTRSLFDFFFRFPPEVMSSNLTIESGVFILGLRRSDGGQFD
jgi:hypothetical protein